MAIAVAVSNLKMDPYFKRKVKGPPFKGNEEMHYEGVRLITFKDWPNWGSVWPTVLAKAGFFYTKTADQVACFCCGGRLKTWEAGDSPMTEHKRFFPQCRFVTGQDSTNVPLGEPSVAPSGGHGGCAPTKADYYSELAKHAAAGRDQASGPSSLNHLTRAISRQRQPPKAGRYASLQCSAMKDAPSVNPHSGLSVAIGGATRIDPLTIEQLQEMKLESKRLQSFSNWPTSAYVCPENLAKAGVYYLGLADRVKCAFCNGILRNWKPGDDALEVHRKLFPKCTFLKDAWAAGNMSIEEEKVNIRQASQNAVANPSPSLGVVPAEEPKSLNYSGETSRLLSFRQWPRNSNQTEDDLARAGFYYTGIGDSVKCFSCHGTVRNWEREDDPWTEHARWFPRCNFVRTVKGEAFIRSVQATHSGQTNAVTSANGTNSANTVTQSASKGACRFPVEPRMVRARMDTTRVRSVLDMGFTRDLVYKVIEHHLTTTGDDFPNVQSLLEAVFVAEESLPGSSSSRTKHHRSVATTSRTSEAAKACNGIAASAAPPVCSDKITTTPAGSSGAVASENQTATSANTSPKGKKRRKKNKSAIGNNGTKTSVSAMESSLSHEMKPEVKVTTSENNRLQCKICMDDEAKILFLPCGHLCSCGKCAPALRNCPICRALIRGTVRVYLS